MTHLPQRHGCACVVPFFNERERIVKTADLLTALAANPSRYQIEIALNRMMLEQGKRVCWMPSSARNTLKVQKHGPRRGLAGDVAMVKNMIDYAGVGAYLEQYLHFAREEARLAYETKTVEGAETLEGLATPSVDWRQLS